MSSIKKTVILDEIMDNVATLPLESQEWLLIIAKSMRYTRNCIIRQEEIKQPDKNEKTKINKESCMGNMYAIR